MAGEGWRGGGKSPDLHSQHEPQDYLSQQMLLLDLKMTNQKDVLKNVKFLNSNPTRK